MPRAAPVMIADLPFNLICGWPFLLVEAVNAAWLRRQKDFRAGRGVKFARGPHRHHAARPRINMQEGVGAQMFRKLKSLRARCRP